LPLRAFLGLGLAEVPPDHSTISRTVSNSGHMIPYRARQAVIEMIREVLGEARRASSGHQ
jgi:hypothetical protein